MLLDVNGTVKLCDFGISGRLVDSKAKTRSAGCAAYMAVSNVWWGSRGRWGRGRKERGVGVKGFADHDRPDCLSNDCLKINGMVKESG